MLRKMETGCEVAGANEETEAVEHLIVDAGFLHFVTIEPCRPRYQTTMLLPHFVMIMLRSPGFPQLTPPAFPRPPFTFPPPQRGYCDKGNSQQRLTAGEGCSMGSSMSGGIGGSGGSGYGGSGGAHTAAHATDFTGGELVLTVPLVAIAPLGRRESEGAVAKAA